MSFTKWIEIKVSLRTGVLTMYRQMSELGRGGECLCMGTKSLRVHALLDCAGFSISPPPRNPECYGETPDIACIEFKEVFLKPRGKDKGMAWLLEETSVGTKQGKSEYQNNN